MKRIVTAVFAVSIGLCGCGGGGGMSNPTTAQSTAPAITQATVTSVTPNDFAITITGSGFVSGSNLLLGGNAIQATVASPTLLTASVLGISCPEGTSICGSRSLAAQQLLTFDTGVSLVQSASLIATRANQYSAMLSAAVKNLPALATAFPNTGIRAQLKQIAQIIQARNALGL